MKNLITSVCMGLFFFSSAALAQDQPSTFTHQVGNYSISLLSEGQQKGSPNILIGIEKGEMEGFRFIPFE